MEPKIIELLRKNIENLTIPINCMSKKEEKLKPPQINKKEKKINDLIEKGFKEIFEIYDNDKEYKKKLEEKKRIKNLKPSSSQSIKINGNLSKEKSFMKKKFHINECFEILEKNNHHSRHESIYEDDFSSSDSYDSELFNLSGTAPKDFRLRTKRDLKENENNLMEIIRVINLSLK